jgi:hypothetical protein
LTLALPAALPAAEPPSRSSEGPSSAQAGAPAPAGRPEQVGNTELVRDTEPAAAVQPQRGGGDDVAPGGAPLGPGADIVPDDGHDGGSYGDAVLRYLTVLPGTFVQGSVDALTGGYGGGLQLRGLPDEQKQCSIAVIFGFEVPNPDAIRELALTYRSPARSLPATVALLTGSGRDPIPLACDGQAWRQQGVLRCDIPASWAARIYGPDRILEVFVMIAGRCPNVQTDDAVSVSTVHLGPPAGDPMPPPPSN